MNGLPTIRPRDPASDAIELDKPREECGVVAISGSGAAAELAFLAMYALQHRGQESAGLVTVDDDGQARTHKGMGLVADIFDNDVLGHLEGSMAIGHVRYSTAGRSSLRNAQPLVVTYRDQPLVLAHNGNLTNAVELRNALSSDGAIFQTDADSEAVVHLIARSRRQDEDQKVDDALPGAARTVPTAWHPGNPWHELGPPVTQTSSRPLGH